MTALFLCIFALVIIFGFIIWAIRLGGRAAEKSIGDLMREQQQEVLKDVEIANEIRRNVPVVGAARRVSDRWDRANRSLLDRRAADGGLPSGLPERRNVSTD